MARTQSFDSKQVVRAAREVFWSAGYEAAAIPELEAQTGLSRSSIYNTFGSKRGLFDAVVQSYLDEVIRPRLQPLLHEHVDPGALRTYLMGLRSAFEHLDAAATRNGCLLINAGGAPIARDTSVAQVINTYRRELEHAIVRGVFAHNPTLQQAEARHRGRIITGLVIAAFATVRVDPLEALRTLDSALETLAALG